MIGLGHPAIAIGIPQQRVEILDPALPINRLQFREERHVIDAGAPIADRLDRQVQIMGQFRDRPLHRMAQSHRPDLWIAFSDCPAIDRHRIDILQENGVRAKLMDGLAQRPEVGDCPETPHDAANTQSITDGLTNPVSGRDGKISQCTRIIPPDLKGDDDKICSINGSPKIRVAGHTHLKPERFNHLSDPQPGTFEPVGIDIHESDLCIPKCLSNQNIPDQVLDEDC